jgi:hypothetical protein
MSFSHSPRQRDAVLDLWRGIALTDMALVHLALYPIGMPHEWAAWIGQYTRFAAGAFVLIAGIAVARVYGARLFTGRETTRRTLKALVRRALLLVCVDRLAAIAFALIEGHRLVPPGVDPGTPSVAALLFLEHPGVTGGLLILYAQLLIITPAIEFLRRRWGAMAPLAASALVYTVAWLGPYASYHSPWPFPFAAWQPLFTVGYVFSERFERLGRGDYSYAWAAVVSLVFAGLFVARNGGDIGLLSPELLPWLKFVKVPLNVYELTWYLVASVFVFTWFAAAWHLAGRLRKALSWLTLLGRKSLLVYVAHLFIEIPIVEFVTVTDPTPPARALMLPLAAALLVIVAGTSERLDRVFAARHISLGRALRIPNAGLVGTGVAVTALLAVLVLGRAVGPPESWYAAREQGDTVIDPPAMDVLPAVQEDQPGVTVVEVEAEGTVIDPFPEQFEEVVGDPPLHGVEDTATEDASEEGPAVDLTPEDDLQARPAFLSPGAHAL